jgi:hypothetical protein
LSQGRLFAYTLGAGSKAWESGGVPAFSFDSTQEMQSVRSVTSSCSPNALRSAYSSASNSRRAEPAGVGSGSAAICPLGGKMAQAPARPRP